ncbi:hypothetical protein [Solibacillus sp. R5-41]|nr:hypothetical protein [Solibacillus sp. R5-41]
MFICIVRLGAYEGASSKIGIRLLIILGGGECANGIGFFQEEVYLINSE